MATKQSESLVLITKQNGIVVIPSATPLKRLNYFDGKFLRASDLKTEQDYVRQLVRLSNQAGGSGVVHGFDLTLGGGDTLNLGPGLGITGAGRVVLLPQDLSIGVQDLIEKSQQLQKLLKQSDQTGSETFEECVIASDEPPVGSTQIRDLYLIVICPAEALCGEEDVYGKLCEEACATSTDRPYALEGLIVQAVPLALQTALPQSKAVSIATKAHLRSRVASAYFEDERKRVASMISKFGLAQQTWCLGADSLNGACLPIGVIARAGATTVFLDPWIARRERMDTPPRRYWQWRMMMRPWDVFLAQILQFQCQLRDLFGGGVFTPEGDDPCGDARTVIGEAAKKLADLIQAHKEMMLQFTPSGNVNQFEAFNAKVGELESTSQKLTATEQQLTSTTGDRLLIRGGIIELPSAGYLPVAPGANATINKQVRQMMGEAVDLRFCVVRPDYVAHAVEEAQHMERISLIEGLNNPSQKPEVDILVPNGEIIEDKRVERGAFEATAKILPDYTDDFLFEIVPRAFQGEGFQNFVRLAKQTTLAFNGAARHEGPDENRHKFYASMLFDDSFLQNLARTFSRLPIARPLDTSREVAAPASGVTKTDAQAAAPSSRIFSRLKTVAAAKRDRSGQPIEVTSRVLSEAPSVSETSTATAVGDATAAGVGVPGGLWLEMNCDRDPAKLAANDVLHANARAVIGAQLPAPLNISVSMDARMSVDFLVDQAGATSGGGNFINGPASVFGSIIVRFGSDKESDSRVANLEVEAKWEKLSTGSGTINVVVSDPSSKEQLTFNGKWGGTSSEIGGVIGSGDDQYFEFGLKPNADVLLAQNQRHQSALAALQVIGSALNNTAFAATASAQLFPPPPKPSDELIVRGTTDWVLFHRRRTKTCGVAKVAPANRRYRVFKIAATPDISLEELVPKKPPTEQDILNTPPKIIKLFRPIGDVTFGGGVATLIGDTTALKTAWQPISDGKILWGAIGSRGDAVTDGDALALFRLKTVESTLDDVSANARADVLPIVPPWLPSADVDGVIVLINGASADLQITKTAVIGKDALGRIITYTLTASNVGPSTAQDVKITDRVPLNTTFVSATPGAADWSIPTPPAVGSAGGVVVFTKASVAVNVPATFVIVVRVDRIPGGAASTTITNTAKIESTTADPKTVTVATAVNLTDVVIPTPPPPPPTTTCLTAFAVLDVDQLSKVRSELEQGIDVLPRVLMALGAINFQKGTINVPDSSLDQVTKNWVDNFGADVSRALLIMSKNTLAADADAFRKQAHAIVAKLSPQAAIDELLLSVLPNVIQCQAGIVLAGLGIT